MGAPRLLSRSSFFSLLLLSKQLSASCHTLSVSAPTLPAPLWRRQSDSGPLMHNVPSRKPFFLNCFKCWGQLYHFRSLFFNPSYSSLRFGPRFYSRMHEYKLCSNLFRNRDLGQQLSKFEITTRMRKHTSSPPGHNTQVFDTVPGWRTVYNLSNFKDNISLAVYIKIPDKRLEITNEL